LGRPYHNDPGVNHEILEEFQKLGYPVFAQDSVPIDDDTPNVSDLALKLYSVYLCRGKRWSGAIDPGFP
jgi:predicted nucleotide-binding protein (sugar kinase/HSP70/actin superfamily)